MDIRFETSPLKKSADFISQHAQYKMEKLTNDEIGFAVYNVNLE